MSFNACFHVQQSAVEHSTGVLSGQFIGAKTAGWKISVCGSIHIYRLALFFLLAVTTVTCLGLPGSFWAYTAFNEAGTLADHHTSLSHTHPRAWHCLNISSATVDVDGDTGGRDKAEVKQAGAYERIISYHFSRGIAWGVTRGINCREEREKKPAAFSGAVCTLRYVTAWGGGDQNGERTWPHGTWFHTFAGSVFFSFTLTHTRTVPTDWTNRIQMCLGANWGYFSKTRYSQCTISLLKQTHLCSPDREMLGKESEGVKKKKKMVTSRATGLGGKMFCRKDTWRSHRCVLNPLFLL